MSASFVPGWTVVFPMAVILVLMWKVTGAEDAVSDRWLREFWRTHGRAK